MKRVPKILLLVLFVVGLYVVTNKAVVPFVLKVVGSDLFFKETEDDPVGELRNDRTWMALLHCENRLRADRDLSASVSPSAAREEYKAWGLGDHTYLIKATLEMPGRDNGPVSANMACKIKYQGGQETDPANWSIIGVDVDSG